MPDPDDGKTAAAAPADLLRGRARYAENAWAEAHALLARADRASALTGEDLERLATAAYLLGRDDEYLEVLERAYHAYAGAHDKSRPARCAFWLGLQLMLRGEAGRASAWLARARRLLEQEGRECVEQGYLLIPAAEQLRAMGDVDAAYESAARAVRIGERFSEADLAACARHLQGRILVAKGEITRGLGLLDEAMLAVTSGELSPLMTGLVYCSVIACCQEVHALGRAQEWTAALARWCQAQPDMVAFSGACLVHRAEILQLHGDWSGAEQEARRACARAAQVPGLRPPAGAWYRQAEIHRLRGGFAGAEEAYREASRLGYEPQPGLALLRLAQGRGDQAAAAIRRALDATVGALARIHLLPAFVEIMLAAGEFEAAGPACDELDLAAGANGSPVIGAQAAQARGALALAQGDAKAALVLLRRALQLWQEVGAPYPAARTRLLIGLACRACGDEDGAQLELEAARAAFAELGAAPDAAGTAAILEERGARAGGLSARELQVLRLVAAGKTNRAIAADLRLSEKTIDRHVSNIYTKLDVPSRAAATAYAYRHKLL